MAESKPDIKNLVINGYRIRCASADGRWFYCINDICRKLMGGSNVSQTRSAGIYDARMFYVGKKQQLEFVDDHGLARILHRGNTWQARSSAKWISERLRKEKMSAAALSMMESIEGAQSCHEDFDDPIQPTHLMGGDK